MVKCAKMNRTDLIKMYAAEMRKSKIVGRTETTTAIQEFPNDVDTAASESMQHSMHEELLNEIELLQALRHPDLVMFMGACLEEGQAPMFITEYMPGGDLEHYFLAQRHQNNTQVWRPSILQLLDWSAAIARALSFLHNCSQPVVHRDLKPLNLLLTKNLQLKVTDFGISKMMTHVQDLDQYEMTGGVGSWLYMAPEVVRHKPYDVKVDIYSFALIIYFMSSGRDPFHELGGDAEVVLKSYIKGNEPRPNVAECHKQLRLLMCTAWHPDASQRPSAKELVRELQEVTAPNEICKCIIV